MAVEIAVVYKIVASAAGVFTTLLMGHVWWFISLKKNVESRLKNLETRAEDLKLATEKHENIFVTEPRTRIVFKEEIAPVDKEVTTLRTDVVEVKGGVMGVMDKVSSLVTEVRIINAIREAEKGRE
jgi:hypothetical protein